jgi:hypothetical protein
MNVLAVETTYRFQTRHYCPGPQTVGDPIYDVKVQSCLWRTKIPEMEGGQRTETYLPDGSSTDQVGIFWLAACLIYFRSKVQDITIIGGRFL